MFTHLRISTKLLVIVAIPLTALLALSAVLVGSRASAAQDALRTDDDSAVATTVADLVTQLQRERALSMRFVGTDRTGTRSDLLQAREGTDIAVSLVTEALQRTAEETRQQMGPASAALGALPDVRQLVDGDAAPDLGSGLGYDAVNDALLVAAADLRLGSDDPSFIRQAAALDALTRAVEATARERDLLAAASTAGRIDSDLVGPLAVAIAAQGINLEQFTRHGAPEQLAAFDEAVAPGTDEEIAAIRDAALATGPEADLDIDPSRWSTLMGDRIDQLRAAETGAQESLAAYARDSSRAAQLQALYLGFAALSLMLLVTGLSFGMARTLSGNIRRLTRAAQRVATTDLPDAVTTIRHLEEGDPQPQLQPFRSRSKDELGTMAAALTTLQDSALDAAYEQHQNERAAQEMLVNLGRRNQALLNRTLSYLSEFERDEQDGRTLEQLFRLDHLATRIRRNAESMLVLAGSDQTRTWRAPVPVMDVLRSALSEIEDYDRVDLQQIDPVDVNGSVVADVAHLLAELLENGTRFSPDAARVTVSGRYRQEGYLLTVSDEGIGMTEEELADANRRIARAGLDRPDSKVLGHYVVGRLASRRGIAVSLVRSALGGVAAKVVLPPSLLTERTPEMALGGGTDADSTTPPAAPADLPAVFDAEAALATPPPAPAMPDPIPTAPAQLQPVTGVATSRAAIAAAMVHRDAADGEDVPDAPAGPQRWATAPADMPMLEPVDVALPDVSTPAPTAPTPPPTGSSPLPRRRVRGAQLPDTDIAAITELPRRSPDHVRSSLSSLQQGVGAARMEAGAPSSAESAASDVHPGAPGPSPAPAPFTRRVRGAQLPDTGPDGPQEEPLQRSADEVRSALGSFQSSVARARQVTADAPPDTPTRSSP